MWKITENQDEIRQLKSIVCVCVEQRSNEYDDDDDDDEDHLP